MGTVITLSRHPPLTLMQSALFNFEALILVLLLAICTSAYVHQIFPRVLDANKDGFVTFSVASWPPRPKLTLPPRVLGIFWKFARIGERLSPYISVACIFMAVRYLIYG